MPDDALGIFANLALATKDVDVSSADNQYYGAIDSRSRFSKHQTGASLPDLYACYIPTADFASIDDFIPYIEDSADGTTFAKILSGVQVGAPALKGKVYTLPVPAGHRPYLRLGATPKSTGTFTARTLQVRFSFGPNQNL